MDESNDEKDIGVSAIVLLIYLISIILTGSIAIGITSPQTSPYGVQRLAVIPVYFDDQQPLTNISELNEKVFNEVDEHVQALSFGMTWLEGWISGWVHLSMSIKTYGEAEVLGGQRLVKDAVAYADPSFDFSNFDRVVIIHSGPSWQLENESYPSTCWAPIIIPTNDGVTFTEAIIVSEEDPTHFLVHELCHGFGAVDLYNLPKSRDGLETNETYIKHWCIMGSGYYEMGLFNKNKIGWIPNDAIFRYSQDSYRLTIISINETTFGFRGVRVDSLNHSGYFLFEARAGRGLLATFVDERKSPGYGIVNLVHVKEEERPYLRVGESYHDIQNNYSIRVICETDTGFNISICKLIEQGVDEFPFSYPLPKQYFYNIDMTESYEHLAYAAFEREKYLPNGFFRYVEVYRTYNYGRDWEFLYNTSIVGMNCSNPSISILNDQPILFVMSWNSSGIGYLEMFNDTMGSSYQRLEDLNQWRTIQTASDRANSQVYVVWDDWNTTINLINFGTWDGTHWNTSWNPIQFAVSPKLSSVSSGPDSRPFLIFRSGVGNRYVNLSRFGESADIHAWTNESIDTFTVADFDVTSVEGVPTIALHDFGWENNTYTDIIRIIKGNVESGFEEMYKLEGFCNPHLFRVNTSDTESIWLSCENRTDGSVTFLNISSRTPVYIPSNVVGEVSISKHSEMGLESVLVLVKGTYNSPTKSLFLFNGPSGPFLESLSYYAQDSDFTINPIYFGVSLLCFLIITPAILRKERMIKLLNPNQKQWSMINWVKEINNQFILTIKEDIPSPKYFLTTYLIGFLALYVSVLLLPTRLLWSSTYLYYWYSIDLLETIFFILIWTIIPVSSIWIWNRFLKAHSN